MLLGHTPAVDVNITDKVRRDRSIPWEGLYSYRGNKILGGVSGNKI